MKPFRGISFDLDGTLLDGSSLEESVAATCEQLASIRADLDAERLVEANAMVWQQYWPEIEHAWPLGTVDQASVGLEIWGRTLRACGCDDDAVARLAVDVFHRFEREAQRLFEDVPDVLVETRNRDLFLAVVTNGPSDAQRGKLRNLGIEAWFDAVVVSGEVGVVKPDGGIFSGVLEKLGGDPATLWHVGDWPPTDVAGARAAGLTSVWLNRTGRAPAAGEPEADLQIRSLTELIPLMG